MNLNDGEILIPLFEALNRKAIRYNVLRNYKGLPESACGSDVDMWVHKDDLDLFYKVINKLKSDNGFHLVSFYGDKTADKLCYLQNNTGVQIDVFKGDIYFKNHILIDCDTILNHTIKYNSVSVMDDDFANLIAFIKEIINNGKCKSKYLNPILNNPVYTKEYLNKNLCCFNNTFTESLYEAISSTNTENRVTELGIKARQNLKAKRFFSLELKYRKLQRLFKRPVMSLLLKEQTAAARVLLSTQ